jgi:purine nucleosidase
MMERSIPSILIDCDPGIDDTLAMLMAFGSELVEVRSVTTVAGNQDIAQVSRNAAELLFMLGERAVAFGEGSGGALAREATRANAIHEGLKFPDIRMGRGRIRQPAVDGVGTLLAAARRKGTETLKLVTLGPLTNISLAVERDPLLLSDIDEIVVMGGSDSAGNITPYAEFNVYNDPEAASRVFALPWRKLTMIGLNVTANVTITRNVVARARALDHPLGTFVARMLEEYRDAEARAGADDACLHDACAVAYALQPQLFRIKPGHIAVELDDPKRLGQTRVFDSAGTVNDQRIAMDVDATGVWNLFFEGLRVLTDRLRMDCDALDWR